MADFHGRLDIPKFIMSPGFRTFTISTVKFGPHKLDRPIQAEQSPGSSDGIIFSKCSIPSRMLSVTRRSC